MNRFIDVIYARDLVMPVIVKCIRTPATHVCTTNTIPIVR